MVNIIILVFVGGAFGAMLREFIMQIVPNLRTISHSISSLQISRPISCSVSPQLCTAGRSCPTTAT